MRITRLDLLRYGKFTDTSVSLPRAAHDFHLIVGPNEAGKSTLRDAIQDLLFGIEPRSRYNFLHAHSEMRLGALIEQGDQQLDFLRTKARSKTLQSATGTPLADNALTPFLGPIERSFFDQMFGLNHDRLVAGGQEILSASNDVGQILFQAAAGIGSLGTIRDKLEQEADGLWAPRKSDKREYYIAASELEKAEAALKQSTVRTKDWQAARSAVDAIAEQLKTARDRYDTLAHARFQLERVRRVAPMLTRLTLVERQVANMGPVVSLPANAAEQLTHAEHELAIAAQSLLLYQEQSAELAEKIAALHPDESILARSADIDALSATRQHVRNHERDMAKREGEIRVWWQDIEEAARQLSWPVEDEEATTRRLPGSLLRSGLDGLVRRHSTLVQTLAATQEALKARADEVKAIDAEISLLPVTVIAVALIDGLSAARALGNVLAQEKRLDAQVAKLKRDLAASELELGQCNPGSDNLRQLLAPSQDESSSLIKRRADLDSTLSATQVRLTETQTEIKSLELEISQYQAAHDPVTLADVTQVRTQRDSTWQAIKTGALTLGAAAAGYEQSVVQADSLSDQRHDKAQEETELQARLDRLQRLQLQLTDLGEREQESAQGLAKFDKTWADRMHALGLSGLALLQVSDWRSARERVLSVASAVAESKAAQQEFRDTVTAATAALAQAMQPIKPVAQSLKLPALILLADELVSASTRAQERRSTLARQKIRAEAAMPDLTQRVAQAQAAIEAWAAELQTKLKQAHLPLDASSAAVEAALLLFERMNQSLQRIRETRVTRIDTMRLDLDDFASAAQALAADLAPELTADRPADISLSLDRELKQHAAAAQELARLKKELGKTTAQATAASSKIAQAKASLEPLLRLSGTTNNDELRAATARSDSLRTLMTEQDQALKQLLSAGDGLERDALAAELAATDADAVSTSLADNKRQTDEVVAEQNKLSGELTAAEATLGKIAGQGEAARAESQRQQALARMGNALERYVKVYTAAKLLRWSIEKFRENKQGPMLARASAVFRDLTQNAFSKLVVDFDSEPLQLSGQRPSGELVEIEGMSEGTRDQLYLALRLAALELHLQQTIALPFIADDLFINYDDGRAKAGLAALAKLSQSTQVIFLSHHAHLVPVAQSVFGAGLNVVMLS